MPSTMLPTACQEVPASRLTVVRSVTCARYAVNPSNGAVNALEPAAHDTRSSRTLQCRHDTRRGA